MATYLTDVGIVLRVIDFSETSQVVGIFTRDHGLVAMIAKGVKRENKKGVVSGPLDLLTTGEVVFVPAKGTGPRSGERSSGSGGTGNELGTLAAWELTDHRTGLRTDLRSLHAAMLCAEVTTLLAAPHEPHEALYDELEATLAALASAGRNATDRARIVLAYVKSALTAAGYAPALAACLVCNRKVTTDPLRFYPRAGGVACAACTLPGIPGAHAIDVPGSIIIALDRLDSPRTLTQNPPTRSADSAALALALDLLLSLVEAVTDREVRTRWLLNSILQPARPEFML